MFKVIEKNDSGQTIYCENETGEYMRFEYDKNNNVIFFKSSITGTETHYEYDNKNRIIKLVENGFVTNFRYTKTGRKKVI